jgi:hypothetical protein
MKLMERHHGEEWFKNRRIIMKRLLGTLAVSALSLILAGTATAGGHYHISSYGYSNYHASYRTQYSYGYRYVKSYSYWSHNYYSPRYGCTCYYDPYTSCTYYFCVPDNCYYPVTYCPYHCYSW